MKYPFAHEFRKVQRDWTLRQYWQHRLKQHHFDHYRGLMTAKLPEDLRTYEHILWATQPDIVIELGGGSVGGSALWFADRLDALCGGGKVISIEIEPMRTDIPEVEAVIEDPRITFITGDLTDKTVASRVKKMARGKKVMIVEDSAHDYDTTLAALELYSSLVKQGQFFIVEDTIVDYPDLTIFGDHGVIPAINHFLKENPRFVKRDMALYGVTMHMEGWLEAMK